MSPGFAGSPRAARVRSADALKRLPEGSTYHGIGGEPPRRNITLPGRIYSGNVRHYWRKAWWCREADKSIYNAIAGVLTPLRNGEASAGLIL